MRHRHSLCFSLDRFLRVAGTRRITSPANNLNYAVPASIQLIAAAADSDGTISQVQFYRNKTLLGTAAKQGNTNSYLLNWDNVPLGNYSITAIATDSQSISKRRVCKMIYLAHH